MANSPKPQHDVQEWLEKHSPDSSDSGSREREISIVIPAYNEQWRLPATIIDIIDYFDTRATNWEVLVVDDGSTDSTCETVQKFQKIRPQVRLISYSPNRGKGHAVRTGVLNSKGQRIIFTDADGSTPIRELSRLLDALDSGADVVIGSRALESQDTQVITHWYRKYPGRLFNFLVNTLIIPGVADTQCGFKAFTAAAGKYLFSLQKADEFSFDVEILYIARQTGMKVVEVPVNWTNAPGSKVNLLIDSLKMLRDILIFKWRHRAIRRNWSPNCGK